jgi:putative membrane protein
VRGVDPSRLVRAALLLSTGLLIAKLFAAGQMRLYMNPALDPLTVMTGLLLAGMGLLEAHAAMGGRGLVVHSPGHTHHEDGRLDQGLTHLLVLLPLVLGLVVAPRALGASALGGQDAARLALAFAPGPESTPAGTPRAPRRPLADVADVLVYLRQVGESGIGQQVHVTGLVARSESLEPNEFVLLRYSIAHCVADARPVGLLVVARDTVDVPTDQWVEVDGTLSSRGRAGNRLVSIVAERLAPVEEPSDPYLQLAPTL